MKATFDIAAKLDLYLRRARAGSKTFTFVDANDDAYDISSLTWQFKIMTNPSATPLISLTSGSGLTISSNQIIASITESDSAIPISAAYYFELYETSEKKTWLFGRCTVSTREPIEGESSIPVTVNTEPDTIRITVSNQSQGRFLGAFTPSADDEYPNVTALAGDWWYSTVDRTYNGEFIPAKSFFTALESNPGQDPSKWRIY